jgi:cellulose synthase/poly-beta-1,6-N-acetylglucosamine synthase-like glycosyltransferase
MTVPSVDVIIAARNEAELVGACVDAVRAQPYAGHLRVCVVDNASTDATASVAAARGAEVVREPKRGAGAARNTGLRTTGGTLVAFLDAHVVVDSDWVRRMVEPFDDPRIGGCQGRLDHRAVSPRVQRYLTASADLWAERIAADSVRGERNLYPWLSTAGCMYRRVALQDVGGFNDHLVACEDVELSWRIIARGYRLAYVSAAPATHYESRSWLRFVTKGFRYGRGAAQVESLYRPHGARTTFRRVRRRRHPEAVLDALSYRLGFRVQQLGQRWGIAPPLESIPPRAVDAAFRPWFTWTPGTQLRISPRAIFWLDDDQPLSVVVQPRARRRYVLEATGNFVWRLLACEHSRDEIAGRIATAYGVPSATVARDLDELVEQLIAAKLVEHDGGSPQGGLGAR